MSDPRFPTICIDCRDAFMDIKAHRRVCPKRWYAIEVINAQGDVIEVLPPNCEWELDR